MAAKLSTGHPAAEGQAPAPVPASPPSTSHEPRQSQSPADDGSVEARRTGAEIPVAIYETIVAAYAWILTMAWLDFSRTVESTWLASVGIIVGIVFFGIPFVLRHTNHAFARTRQRDLEEFLHSNVETATGRLPGWEAYLQIMVIPICLALAATALGAVWVWEG